MAPIAINAPKMPTITIITIPAIFFLLLAFFRTLIPLLASAVGRAVGSAAALGAVEAACGAGIAAVGVGGLVLYLHCQLYKIA